MPANGFRYHASVPPEEERCHLLASDLDVILEEELQRQPS
jgi:hypothetical protein